MSRWNSFLRRNADVALSSVVNVESWLKPSEVSHEDVCSDSCLTASPPLDRGRRFALLQQLLVLRQNLLGSATHSNNLFFSFCGHYCGLGAPPVALGPGRCIQTPEASACLHLHGCG